MSERLAFASLALQLRRQWHQYRRWAGEALAAGKPGDVAKWTAEAAKYLEKARWYLGKAKDRPAMQPEN